MKHLVTVIACLALLASSVSAETLLVPKDYATIQEAVDAANQGDVIRVKKKTYKEAVEIIGKSGITLLGAGKPTVSGGVDEEGFYLLNCTDIVIRGFSFRTPHRIAIALESCDRVVIDKCQIDGPTEDGILTYDCSELAIRNTKISNTGIDGISLSGSDFFPSPPTTDCVISGVKVKNAGDDGIEILGHRNRVENCKFDGCGDDGVQINDEQSGSRENEIVGCKTKNCGDEGYEIGGHDHLIENCMDKGAGSDSFDIEGDLNTIRNCKSVKSSQGGFEIDEGNNTLTDCTAIKPGEHGFQIYDSGSVIEGCQAKKAGDCGIRFEPGAIENTVRDTKVRKSGRLDVDDPNGDGANTLENVDARTSNVTLN